jgi:hypothetical protein
MKEAGKRERGGVFKLAVSAISICLLLCATAVGQCGPLPTQNATFHVQGTITDLQGFVAPGTEVTFKSNQVNRVVTVNERAFYETDLPFGLYTMTAQAPDRFKFLRKYVRPLFRVMAPMNVTLNGILDYVGRSCDIRWSKSAPPEDPDQLENAVKDLCGGEDSLTAASAEGVPFQLHVRYWRRSSADQSYVYSGERVNQIRVPVFVEYNLFSLEADKVIYYTKNRTIAASGSVVVTADDSGKTQHFDSIGFRIENGQAIPLN